MQIDFGAGLVHDLLKVIGNATLGGTLNVSVLNLGVAQLGNTFEIIQAAGFGGSTFTTTNLPNLSAGLVWGVNYGPTSVTLSVNSAGGPSGDFNGNGVVDAADYVVWREGVAIANTPANYDLWRSSFGQTVPASGAGAESAAVPEAPTWCLLGASIAMLSLIRVGRAAEPKHLLEA
jgi:hypothetical protein